MKTEDKKLYIFTYDYNTITCKETGFGIKDEYNIYTIPVKKQINRSFKKCNREKQFKIVNQTFKTHASYIDKIRFGINIHTQEEEYVMMSFNNDKSLFVKMLVEYLNGEINVSEENIERLKGNIEFLKSNEMN